MKRDTVRKIRNQMKSKEELLQIFETAKELGMTKITIDGAEYQLDIIAKPTGPVPEMSAEEIVNPLSVLDEMDEDEIKYWSSPYYDELMANKERQRSK